MNFSNFNEYDYWANQEVLKLIIDNRLKTELGRHYHHILEANTVWYSRIQNLPIDPKIWEDDFVIEEFPDRTNINYHNMKNLLKETDFNKRIEYKNTKGEIFDSKIEDILSHVFNHSTHHRAQILLLCNQFDIPRPALDFIHYTRTILG